METRQGVADFWALVSLNEASELSDPVLSTYYEAVNFFRRLASLTSCFFQYCPAADICMPSKDMQKREVPDQILAEGCQKESEPRLRSVDRFHCEVRCLGSYRSVLRPSPWSTETDRLLL